MLKITVFVTLCPKLLLYKVVVMHFIPLSPNSFAQSYMSQIHIAHTQGRNHEMLRFMFIMSMHYQGEVLSDDRAFMKDVVKREFAYDLGVAFLFHETCFNILLSK